MIDRLKQLLPFGQEEDTAPTLSPEQKAAQALGELGTSGEAITMEDITNSVVPGSKAWRNLQRSQAMLNENQQ